MDEKLKQWIDGASYEQLLRRWRFAPVGDPAFQDEAGDYYKTALVQKRAEEPDSGVAASKRIGWN